MEPTYSVPTLHMALRIAALVATATGVSLLFRWWRLRNTKRAYLLEQRRKRGIAGLVLLGVGVALFLFAPYEVRNDRIDFRP
jgi:hypothetical protein